MMKKLDLILIDAFQDEYYQYCPFLSRLKEEYFSADLTPVIGYQQQLASLFSGSRPDEIDVWNTFKYSPETSVFGWTKPFSLLKFLDLKLFKYLIDLISYLSAGIGDMMPVRIPIKVMNNFDIVLRQPITAKKSPVKPNIFNLMRENRISFSYFKGGLKYADRDEGKRFLGNLAHLFSRSDKKTVKNALKDNSDFKFIYLMELDGLTHRFGVDSSEVRAKVKEIDRLLEAYLSKSNRSFMIISDHGMVRVKETLDLISPVSRLGLVQGKDYLVFLESVIALFWFFNRQAEEKISGVLKKIKGGHVLNREEKERFGINFKDDRFGQVQFLLEPGVIIRPDYYRSGGAVRAMHGYSPESYKGVLITDLELKNNREINFIDIIPTIAGFWALPKIGSGRNLFARKESNSDE